jgi:hypothetical protein
MATNGPPEDITTQQSGAVAPEPPPPPQSAEIRQETPPTATAEAATPDPTKVLETSICVNCENNGDGTIEACGVRQLHSMYADDGIEDARNIQGCSSFVEKGA